MTLMTRHAHGIASPTQPTAEHGETVLPMTGYGCSPRRPTGPVHARTHGAVQNDRSPFYLRWMVCVGSLEKCFVLQLCSKVEPETL